jgi:EmrB/QacA subfamily drug resistance transporter
MSSKPPTLGGEQERAEISPPGLHEGHDLPRRIAILVVLGIFLSLLMGALDNFVVLTALPNIVSDLGQPTGVTFVVSSYLIASTIAIPIFAKLSDILSRRNVFLLGLVIFIAGSALAGLSQNLSELVAFRGLQGFGSGAFFPVGIAITAVLFSPEMRARITGVFSGVFGIATVAGPFLGSFIVDHTTWRWVFYINIPIGIAGIGVISAVLGPLRPEVRGRFDIPGALSLTGWVGALMLALYEVSNGGWSWTDPRTVGLLTAAAAIAVAFVLWEIRTDHPLVPLRHFSNRIVAASGASAFLRGTWFFALLTFISVYVGIVLLHGGKGAADSVRNVLYFLVIPMVLGAALGGQLLTRLAYRRLMGLGLGLACIGILLLTQSSASTPLWRFSYGFLPTGGIILPLIPIGFGMGLTFAAPVMASQFAMPTKEVGAATGLIQFLQTLGGSLGLSLLATFQQSRFQSLDPPPTVPCSPYGPPNPACVGYLQSLQGALVTSYDEVFWVMLGLAVAALVAGLLISGRMPKGESTRRSPPPLPEGEPRDGGPHQ